MSTPPGWYPAPGDPPGTQRYWDGANWTTDPQPAGQPPAPQQPAAAPQQPQRVAGQFGVGGPAVSGSHVVDYEVRGDDLQFVEVELDPGETVIGEAGTMMFVEDGITFEAKMGDGSAAGESTFKKLLGAGKRVLTGESLFLTHFTNHGSGKARVAFAANYPGKIVAVNLGELGGRLIAQKDSFLCAAFGTRVSIAFNRRIGAGFLGGEGFVLQDLQGDGNVFLHAGGTVVEKQLTGGTLRIDTGCIVALEPQLEYSIERAGNLRSMVFGGEGLVLATVRGTGRVWLQSLPFERLAAQVGRSVATGGAGGDEGSALGGLSTLFER